MNMLQEGSEEPSGQAPCGLPAPVARLASFSNRSTASIGIRMCRWLIISLGSSPARTFRRTVCTQQFQHLATSVLVKYGRFGSAGGGISSVGFPGPEVDRA